MGQKDRTGSIDIRTWKLEYSNGVLNSKKLENEIMKFGEANQKGQLVVFVQSSVVENWHFWVLEEKTKKK